MTRPTDKQLFDLEIPSSVVGLIGAIYRKNGILVVMCIIMVSVLYVDGRERDRRLEDLLTSNASVLASNAAVVREMSDDMKEAAAKTSSSVSEMRTVITRIETGIDRIATHTK
jgi:RecJ-like exonuclease